MESLNASEMTLTGLPWSIVDCWALAYSCVRTVVFEAAAMDDGTFKSQW